MLLYPLLLHSPCPHSHSIVLRCPRCDVVGDPVDAAHLIDDYNARGSADGLSRLQSVARTMGNRVSRVSFGSRAAVVAGLMVRLICPQLRNCRERPGNHAWCHKQSSAFQNADHRNEGPQSNHASARALRQISWRQTQLTEPRRAGPRPGNRQDATVNCP
jgi:hypothetical protein